MAFARRYERVSTRLASAGGVASVRRQARILVLALRRDIRDKQAELKRLKREEKMLERLISLAAWHDDLART